MLRRQRTKSATRQLSISLSPQIITKCSSSSSLSSSNFHLNFLHYSQVKFGNHSAYILDFPFYLSGEVPAITYYFLPTLSNQMRMQNFSRLPFFPGLSLFSSFRLYPKKLASAQSTGPVFTGRRIYNSSPEVIVLGGISQRFTHQDFPLTLQISCDLYLMKNFRGDQLYFWCLSVCVQASVYLVAAAGESWLELFSAFAFATANYFSIEVQEYNAAFSDLRDCEKAHTFYYFVRIF